MTPICRRIFRFPVLRFVFQSSTSHLVIQVGWLPIPENLLDEKGYYKKWHETCFTRSERITSISPKVLPFWATSFFKHLPAFHPHKIVNNNKKIHKCLPTIPGKMFRKVQKYTSLNPSPTFPWFHLTEPKPTKVHALTNAAATSLERNCHREIQGSSGHHTGTYDYS